MIVFYGEVAITLAFIVGAAVGLIVGTMVLALVASQLEDY